VSSATTLRLVDDHHALAGLLDLGEDVRAEDDGVIAGERLDEAASLVDLLGVEPRRRFVEDQHFGVVDERLREADALAIALRELSARAVGHVGHPRAGHDLIDPCGAILGATP
jgi:hypothetical protein